MTRGRKKKDESLNKIISIRITEKHKEIIEKNAFIKEEVAKVVREHLDMYVMK